MNHLDWAHSLAQEKWGGRRSIRTWLEEGGVGFTKMIGSFEEKSSGVSSRYHNKKKSSFAFEHAEEVLDLSACRIILIAVAGIDITMLSGTQMIEFGISDIKELFIKGEVHSPEKMTDGRYRLICIMSLIDCAVQILLHKADNIEHIQAYQTGELTCAGPGLGHDDVGIDRIIDALSAENLVTNCRQSMDASGWDLSVPAVLVTADGWRRSDNIDSSYVADFVAIYTQTLTKIVVSAGDECWIVERCCVITGEPSTTASNCYERGVTAAYGGALNWFNVGDDLVTDVRFDATIIDRDLGIMTRDLVEHGDEFVDITSHTINLTTGTAKFLNVEKMLWHLYNESMRGETGMTERIGGCLFALRNTPGVYDDLRAIGDMMTPDISRHIFDTCAANDLS
jgi:hypothetical protein